jgi:IS1 family transposase
MAISERINQHKLKEILMNIYARRIETENSQVKDLIEEIKKQVLADSKSIGR